MLSILIPVYACDARTLVRALHTQAGVLGVDFEILAYDDASPAVPEGWAELVALDRVKARRMSQNLGRAKLRNRLAADARGAWLLFLDADAAVPDAQYLARYWAARHRAPVLCGGTAYQSTPPSNAAHYLRWHFGRHREQSTAATRSAAPYASFSTFNFMIQRPVFQSIGFDAALQRYGHEDTLFGWELAQRGIPIAHLNNPLIHLGLDTAAQFLAKTERGIQNLHGLQMRYPGFRTRLLDAADRYAPLLPLLGGLRGILERQLLGRRPSLWLFDLWKLAVYTRVMSAV